MEKRSVHLSIYVAAIAFLLLAAGNAAITLGAFRAINFGTIRQYYNFNTLYWPILAAAAGIFGTMASVKGSWGRRIGVVMLSAGVFLFLVRIYCTHIEPGMLFVREVRFASDKVERQVKILHFSDLQPAKMGSHERAAFAKIRELKPDLVVYTGDYFQPKSLRDCGELFEEMKALFESLHPPLGMYGVNGNLEPCMGKVRDSNFGGLKILAGKTAVVETGGAVFNILGLTFGQSRYNYAGKGLIDRWLASSGEDDFKILVGHTPDFAMYVQDMPIDLLLAGHTHGGQIRLPFIGPLFIMSKVPFRWARGYTETGKTRLNVSAGVGYEHAGRLPAIRFNCPPEMSLIIISPLMAAAHR